jgi:hypothetical protein
MRGKNKKNIKASNIPNDIKILGVVNIPKKNARNFNK